MAEVGASPWGSVSLAAAIAALRSELLNAWPSRQATRFRFRPSPGVVSDKSAKAGVKWWLLEAGGEVSRQLGSTHTVKLTLESEFFDEDGEPTEFLVSDLDDTATTGGDIALGDVDD